MIVMQWYLCIKKKKKKMNNRPIGVPKPDVSDFVSYLFLSFFKLWLDVLLFKPTSLCLTGSV